MAIPERRSWSIASGVSGVPAARMIRPSAPLTRTAGVLPNLKILAWLGATSPVLAAATRLAAPLGQNAGVMIDLSPFNGGGFATRVARVPVDIDGDGDVDLVVTQNGRKAVLLRNNSAPRSWIRIKLIGSQS